MHPTPPPPTIASPRATRAPSSRISSVHFHSPEAHTSFAGSELNAKSPLPPSCPLFPARRHGLPHVSFLGEGRDVVGINVNFWMTALLVLCERVATPPVGDVRIATELELQSRRPTGQHFSPDLATFGSPVVGFAWSCFRQITKFPGTKPVLSDTSTQMKQSFPS